MLGFRQAIANEWSEPRMHGHGKHEQIKTPCAFWAIIRYDPGIRICAARNES
jgi:hypothetical protein